MSIAERIRETRKDKGLSQSDLAERTGVTRGACGQWERGESAPSVENLARVAVILDVRFEWLATGRGTKEYESVARDVSPPVHINPPHEMRLSDDERQLLAVFGRLSAASRSTLIAFLKTLQPGVPV